MKDKKGTVTIRELAACAQVSPATVSRVINSSGYVSDAARKRVEAAIKELGFVPNARARGLSGRPSGLVALIIPSILNIFYTALSESIENSLKRLGYVMLLGVTDDDPDLYLTYLKRFAELKADGIIAVPPPGSKCLPMIQRMVELGIPMVEVNRRHEHCVLDAVLADNFQGARQGTEYLVSLGHRRIALIIGSLETSTGRERLAGFRWVLANAGIEVDPDLIKIGEFSKEFGVQATEELLALPMPPTAIFATSNRILVGVVATLTHHGLRVPEDVSLLSFDDSEWLSIWRPSITAVDIAIDEMGTLAVELLMRWIRSGQRPETPRTYSLSTALIPRESCRPLLPHSPKL